MSVPSFTVERRHRGQRSDVQRAADRVFGVSPLPAVTAPARTIRTPLSGGELATLERLVDRVRQNEPDHHRPERFHVEKSEIADALRRVIGALRLGQQIPAIEDKDRGKTR